jgi:hypothetical protein
MADTRDVATREDEGPRQTVRRMPDDQPEVGPFYPSGMSAPEAAIAGATADIPEEELPVLYGEERGGAAKTTKSSKKDTE